MKKIYPEKNRALPFTGPPCYSQKVLSQFRGAANEKHRQLSLAKNAAAVRSFASLSASRFI
jgi:hypothetical protein